MSAVVALIQVFQAKRMIRSSRLTCHGTVGGCAVHLGARHGRARHGRPPSTTSDGEIVARASLNLPVRRGSVGDPNLGTDGIRCPLQRPPRPVASFRRSTGAVGRVMSVLAVMAAWGNDLR